MFYAVCRQDGLRVQVPIRKDNIVTRCVKCGRVMHVDLEAVFGAGDVYLGSTQIVCEKCSGKAGTRLLVDGHESNVLLDAIKGLMEET